MTFEEIKYEFRKLVKESPVAWYGYLYEMEDVINDLWGEMDGEN